MKNARVRPVALVLLLTQTLACYGWSTQAISPEQLITEQQPQRVRVTGVSGQHLVLWQPFVCGDSIVGQTEFGETPIAMSNIRAVGVRRVNPVATGLLLVVGVPVVVGVGVFLSFLARCGQGGCSS